MLGMRKVIKKLLMGRENWETKLKQLEQFPKESPKNKKILNEIVLQGIPKEHRATLWKILLGIDQRKADNVGLYDKYKQVICEVAKEESDTKTTNKEEPKEKIKFFLNNMNRLLPRLPGSLSSSIKGTRLIHAWCAYLLNNEKVEFYSSMGFQFTLLVDIFENEEDVFWAETALNEIYAEFYQIGRRTEEEYCKLFIFEKLIEKNFPQLHQHFQTLFFLGIGMANFTHSWMATCFINEFPCETDFIYRIYDAFIIEGPLFLYKLGCAIFQLCESALLKTETCDDFLKELRQFFDNLPSSNITCNSLIKSALKVKIKVAEFNSYACEFFDKKATYSAPCGTTELKSARI